MQTSNVAQSEAIQRTFLQRFDVPGGDFETLIGLSEIAPNESSGRQSHPGIEGGYILDGGLTITVDGQPALTLRAGQSWKLPPHAVHDVKGGADGAKVIATWVVEKGQPFVSPAS